MAALRVVLVGAALLLLAAPGRAGWLTLESSGSSLAITLPRLPSPHQFPISIGPNASTPILVSSGAGSFALPATVFGPATVQVPTAFTGTVVTQISAITIAGLANGPLSFDGGLGTAVGSLQGVVIVNILQLLNLSIPLSPVGLPGATAMATQGAIMVTVVGQGWTTGVASVTGLSTSPLTTLGATSFLTGSNVRTPGHAGTVTLVSGFRVVTGVAGILPGFAIQTLSFSVPEPGALGLLGSGILGCVWVARRKARRHDAARRDRYST